MDIYTINTNTKAKTFIKSVETMKQAFKYIDKIFILNAVLPTEEGLVVLGGSPAYPIRVLLEGDNLTEKYRTFFLQS